MAEWDDCTLNEARSDQGVEDVGPEIRAWRQEVRQEVCALRREQRARRVEVPLWSGLIVGVIVAMALLNHWWRSRQGDGRPMPEVRRRRQNGKGCTGRSARTSVIPSKNRAIMGQDGSCDTVADRTGAAHLRRDGAHADEPTDRAGAAMGDRRCVAG